MQLCGPLACSVSVCLRFSLSSQSLNLHSGSDTLRHRSHRIYFFVAISMTVTRAFRTGCMAGQSPNKPGAVRRSTVDVPRTPAVVHPCHPGVMRSVTGAAAISRRAVQPPLCHPRNVMQFARTRGNLRPAWTASIGPSATCLLAVTMPVLSDTVRCKLSAVFAVPAVLRRPVVHCMWRLPQPSTATRH